VLALTTCFKQSLSEDSVFLKPHAGVTSLALFSFSGLRAVLNFMLETVMYLLVEHVKAHSSRAMNPRQLQDYVEELQYMLDRCEYVRFCGIYHYLLAYVCWAETIS